MAIRKVPSLENEHRLISGSLCRRPVNASRKLSKFVADDELTGCQSDTVKAVISLLRPTLDVMGVDSDLGAIPGVAEFLVRQICIYDRENADR